ncbi:hypothetical protein FGIG_03298 [Fasciola gigantica]|uniref:Uncharacterized protein n=1 Tax=Fasciola gigantica TaxID=46835 RepID=A0A504YFU9_FASGI|nr:hypothetical protein FGIG_03298 [Fasciola gigantica]
MKFQLLNKRAVFHEYNQTEDNKTSWNPISIIPLEPTSSSSYSFGRANLTGHTANADQSDLHFKPPILSVPTPLERRSLEPISDRQDYGGLPALSAPCVTLPNGVSEQMVLSVQGTSSSSSAPTTPSKVVGLGNPPIRPRKMVLDEDKRLAKRRLIEANRARKRAEVDAVSPTSSGNVIQSPLNSAPTMFANPTYMTSQLTELQTTPHGPGHSIPMVHSVVETLGPHLYAVEQSGQPVPQPTIEVPSTVYWSRMVAPNSVQKVQSTGFTAALSAPSVMAPPQYPPILQPYGAHSFEPIVGKEDTDVSFLMIPPSTPSVETKRVCFSLKPQGSPPPVSVTPSLSGVADSSSRLTVLSVPLEPTNSSQLIQPISAPSGSHVDPISHEQPLKPVSRVQPPSTECAWTKDDEAMVDSIRQAYREMLIPCDKSMIHADNDDAGSAFRSIPPSTNISTLIEPIIARLVAFAKLIPGFGLVSDEV